MVNKKEAFIKKIQSIYPDNPEILAVVEKKNLPTVFRVNVSETSSLESIAESLKSEGFSLKEGPLPRSYVVLSEGSKHLTDTRAYQDGKIYIQSLSSMLPATILLPVVGDQILDICAAPGSKTSQIASLVAGKALIVAVENNSNRFHLLKNTLTQQGFSDVITLKSNAAILCKAFPHYQGYFNKVLCDVPCSNEGVVRNLSEEALYYWNSKLSKNLSQLQKKILFSGIEALKPGGTLVYSTCTYSVNENESVVDWALRTFKNIYLEDFKLPINNFIHGFTSWQPEFNGKKKVFDDSLVLTKRILPTEFFDGFYLAKFRKQA